jgi:hypothetical protein
MSGTGATIGHHLVATVLGTSNTHTVTQSGSVSTTVNIATNGSSNTVTVSTGN